MDNGYLLHNTLWIMFENRNFKNMIFKNTTYQMLA